jgi:hypothetical protein
MKCLLTLTLALILTLALAACSTTAETGDTDVGNVDPTATLAKDRPLSPIAGVYRSVKPARGTEDEYDYLEIEQNYGGGFRVILNFVGEEGRNSIIYASDDEKLGKGRWLNYVDDTSSSRGNVNIDIDGDNLEFTYDENKTKEFIKVEDATENPRDKYATTPEDETVN